MTDNNALQTATAPLLAPAADCAGGTGNEGAGVDSTETVDFRSFPTVANEGGLYEDSEKTASEGEGKEEVGNDLPEEGPPFLALSLCVTDGRSNDSRTNEISRGGSRGRSWRGRATRPQRHRRSDEHRDERSGQYHVRSSCESKDREPRGEEGWFHEMGEERSVLCESVPTVFQRC